MTKNVRTAAAAAVVYSRLAVVVVVVVSIILLGIISIVCIARTSGKTDSGK